MNIKILILDDEKLPGLNLENRLLELFNIPKDDIIVCSNPKLAIEILNSEHIDILFLDINMPQMSGFGLLEKFPNPNFEVVFVTAHDQHAIRAFKAHAADYLLKPVDDDDLSITWNYLTTVIGRKKEDSDYKSLNNSIESDNISYLRINNYDGFCLKCN